MNKLDDMIREALADETERLGTPAAEPGFFAQSLGLFRGPNGWVTAVIMASQTALFIAGVWCAVRFFGATEALAAVKWGLSGTVLLISSITLKLSLMPQMQAERVLRELRRLELVLAAR